MTNKVTTVKRNRNSSAQPTIVALEVGGVTDEEVGGDGSATVTMVMEIHIT